MKVGQKLVTGFIKLKLKLLAFFSKKMAAEKAFQLFCKPFAKPIKKVPAVFEKAEIITFNFNGSTIRGYRWNHPKAHKVLIIHGFSSAAYKFSSYVEAFINKDYEVLAFDAPAHGNSEGKTVNALVYSEMIKKVIELYGPVNSFMAHSFGGLALSLALENIQHDDTARIVFIAPATETNTAIDTALNVMQLKDATVRKEIDNIIFKISGKETSWFSMRRAMNNIKAKVLWIHDEDDDATPVNDALKVKEDNHPNIEFIITKGLGHRRIYHDIEVKKRVVDFL
jgi:pimeloyl-ACP methyl ester carboxylesterase